MFVWSALAETPSRHRVGVLHGTIHCRKGEQGSPPASS
jgi:hypothetical protein